MVVVVVMSREVVEVVGVLVVVEPRGVVMGDHLVALQAMEMMTQSPGIMGQESLLQTWTPSAD